MGISEEEIGLAVKRLNNIIKNDRVNVVQVLTTVDNTICLELENGMNFELSASEVEHQANEQRKDEVLKLDRDEVVNEITQNYVDTMHNDMNQGDFSFIFQYVRGDGGTQIDRMTNEELVVEYKELFNKELVIID